jgi:hypothetical protein
VADPVAAVDADAAALAAHPSHLSPAEAGGGEGSQRSVTSPGCSETSTLAGTAGTVR